MEDQTNTLIWRKASLSSANGQCVEVADIPDGGIAVRDSKNPDGHMLRVTTSAWHAFLHDLRAG